MFQSCSVLFSISTTTIARQAAPCFLAEASLFLFIFCLFLHIIILSWLGVVVLWSVSHFKRAPATSVLANIDYSRLHDVGGAAAGPVEHNKVYNRRIISLL